jgi:Arc/MetJ family transcription regulator
VTTIAIDDRLLNEAQRIGGCLTKKATVIEALHEYIENHKRAKVLELVGTVDFDPNYDYKKQRRKR